ncbi:hypothetical protein GINT2_000852 [Glugoides intestinalis]
MEKVKELVIEKVLKRATTVVIGKIDGENAIYIIPRPVLKLDSFPEDVFEHTSYKFSFSIFPRLIFPASEKHLAKYLEEYAYRTETYEEYLKTLKCLGTNWIDNIVTKKCTTEKIYFENDDFLIIADYKWDQSNIESLYLLLIFKDDNLLSLRNIKETAILASAKAEIYAVCKSFGVPENQMCLFFHYRPSYFRMHIHAVNISKSLSLLGNFSRVVFLDDVIKNLKLDPEYYLKPCHYIDKV